MLFFSELKIDKLIIHSVGNKLKGDTCLTSEATVVINSEIEEVLLKFLLAPIKANGLFVFDNLNHNQIYKSVHEMFDSSEIFVTVSKRVARILFDSVKNPEVIGGNLIIVHFKDCIVGDKLTDAIGIFKTDTTDTYLKIKPSSERFMVTRENGLGLKRISKGCIICNTEYEQGYVIAVYDKRGRGEEVLNWSEQFLDIIPRKDDYYFTKNAIDCVVHFVNEGLPDMFEISKADQLNLLNSTSEYLKTAEDFNWNEFAEEVFESAEVVEGLNGYKDSFEQDNDVEIEEQFKVSIPALKQENKKFKRVIKLDDRFDIILHKGKENLIRGVDEATGMNYYQILFKNEE